MAGGSKIQGIIATTDGLTQIRIKLKHLPWNQLWSETWFQSATIRTRKNPATMAPGDSR